MIFESAKQCFCVHGITGEGGRRFASHNDKYFGEVKNV